MIEIRARRANKEVHLPLRGQGPADIQEDPQPNPSLKQPSPIQ